MNLKVKISLGEHVYCKLESAFRLVHENGHKILRGQAPKNIQLLVAWNY
jgi:hypothetical protein